MTPQPIQSNLAYWRDIVLYGTIAFLAAYGLTKDPLGPREYAAIALAVLTTVKAKLSPGKDQTQGTSDATKGDTSPIT